MMKSRIALVFAISLLILGVALYTFSARNQLPAQILPAAINRDCAPWDGVAFTARIPLDNGDVIGVSIWQSPEIKSAVTFSFPDETGQVGNASLIHKDGMPEQLTGTVTFSSVEQSSLVEGQFDLRDGNGKQFKGRFKAEWGNQIIMCG